MSEQKTTTTIEVLAPAFPDLRILQLDARVNLGRLLHEAVTAFNRQQQ